MQLLSLLLELWFVVVVGHNAVIQGLQFSKKPLLLSLVTFFGVAKFNSHKSFFPDRLDLIPPPRFDLLDTFFYSVKFGLINLFEDFLS
jgi:hypothetical protein